MRLKDLSAKERKALAKAASTDHVYLYQCGTGTRKPSPALCKRLVEVDARLSLSDLRPDIWGSNEGAASSKAA